MKNKEEIIFGAGEVYMYEFTEKEIPEDAVIETEVNNVGHCSGGFSVDYKPENMMSLINMERRYAHLLLRKK